MSANDSPFVRARGHKFHTWRNKHDLKLSSSGAVIYEGGVHVIHGEGRIHQCEVGREHEMPGIQIQQNQLAKYPKK